MNSLSFLAQEAPGFALRGSQVKVIREPAAFYQVKNLERTKFISPQKCFLFPGAP